MIRFGQSRRRTKAQVQADKVAKEAAKLKAKEDAKKAEQVDAMMAKLEQQQQEIAAAEQFRDNVIAQGLCQWDGHNNLELTAAGRAAAEAHHSQQAASEGAADSEFNPVDGGGQQDA